ncbi:hypothetical protein, partial [Burkholderia cenocepacia]|uniref:hypothetical protein n=1 Tax=Burkholderia cenocepacia TaxID=95486 RepID=UPI001B9DA861
MHQQIGGSNEAGAKSGLRCTISKRDGKMISYRLSTHVRGFGAGLYAGSGIGWLRRDWRTSSGTLNCAAT